MGELKYILRANEMAWVPRRITTTESILRFSGCCLVFTILFASILFRENLFLRFSFLQRVLLFFLFFRGLMVRTRKKAPQPFSIRFYDDCLVLHRPKRYYSPRLSRMEIDCFPYQKIQKIQYRTQTQKLCIYGTVEGTWFNYRKDGTLSPQPSYHKTTDSFSYFYTSASPEIDFVAEIQAHTPIRVEVIDG